MNTHVGPYYGEDVLEGFAADAEHMGKTNESNPSFDQSFYKLCKLDNYYVFEFPTETQFRIPPMKLTDLNRIIFK